MAMSLLGPSLDLHSGGSDLAFPHHAYEAAQAEAVTGVRPFARAWMHVGMVNLDGEKMSKSKGNLVFVRDLLERWPAEALRLLLLDRRYDDVWDFAEDDMAAAADRVDRLWSQAGRRRDDDAAEKAAVAALLDDLDAHTALAVAEETGGRTARTIGSLLGVL
jgi:cysteinyl-tRNA synthetase